MAQQPITNLRALKGYRRFSEFCKLIIAGFSAILLFSFDKIECIHFKLIEGAITILGIGICATALIGFNQSADRIDEEIEMKNINDAEAYKKEIAVIDSVSHFLYIASFFILATSAVLFVLNPVLCSAKEKSNKANITNTYNTTILNDSCKTESVKSTPKCKKAMLSGTCQCKQ